MKALWVGILVALSATNGLAQFSEKWDQFLPQVVTPFGNGSIRSLYSWEGDLVVGIVGGSFVSTDGEIWQLDASISQRPTRIVNGHAFRKREMSDDLQEWRPIATIEGEIMPIVDIAFGEGWWVAVTSFGQILRSQDLKIWRSERTPTQNPIFSIVYYRNQFVALGTEEMLTSPSGEFWDFSIADGHSPAGNATYLQVLGDYVVATDGKGRVIISSDAKDWKENHLTGVRAALGYGDGNYLAVGDRGKCYFSTDFFTWRLVSLPGTWDLHAVTYFNDRWYIGGNNGALLVANPVEGAIKQPFDLGLRIAQDGTLAWEADAEQSLTVEDSLDMEAWSTLSKVDPGVGKFAPPVNTDARFYRLKK